MSVTLNLFRLQQVDTRIDQVTIRLAAIQSALENDAELKAVRLTMGNAELATKEAEKALKMAEDEAARQRIKLEQAESSLYSGMIHNPKELQDLQNDVASLKRHLATLEDSQLEAMLTLETVRFDMEAAHKAFIVAQGSGISKNASLNTEYDSLQKEAEKLATQRLAALTAIDTATLAIYDALRQKRRRLAVTTLSDNACDACGAALTPGHAQSVRFSPQIVNCPSCGRILFAN